MVYIASQCTPIKMAYAWIFSNKGPNSVAALRKLLRWSPPRKIFDSFTTVDSPVGSWKGSNGFFSLCMRYLGQILSTHYVGAPIVIIVRACNCAESLRGQAAPQCVCVWGHVQPNCAGSADVSAHRMLRGLTCPPKWLDKVAISHFANCRGAPSYLQLSR